MSYCDIELEFIDEPEEIKSTGALNPTDAFSRYNQWFFNPYGFGEVEEAVKTVDSQWKSDIWQAEPQEDDKRPIGVTMGNGDVLIYGEDGSNSNLNDVVVKALSSKNKMMRKGLESAYRQVDKLRDELRISDDSIDALIEGYDSLSDDFQELYKENKELKSQLDLTKYHWNRINNQNVGLIENRDSVLSSLRNAHDKISVLESLQARLVGFIESLIRDKSKLSLENDKLKRKNEQLELDMRGLSQTYESRYEEEYDDLRDRYKEPR